MTVKLAAAIERDEEQHERRDHEREHSRENVLRDRVTGGHDASGVARRAERLDTRFARLHQHRDERGAGDRGGRKQHELVAEVTRVLDRADNGALHSVEVDRRACFETEGRERRCR